MQYIYLVNTDELNYNIDQLHNSDKAIKLGIILHVKYRIRYWGCSNIT